MEERVNTSMTDQYLTFSLANELYALAIEKVREVLDYTTLTHVPRMPAFLRGVINLRGNVVPVIDLRLCLGLEAAEKTVDSCIVIVEVMVNGELLLVGGLTDAVQEVIDIEPRMIRPPVQLGMKLPTEFIQGMGIRDDGFVIIIDIDRVLTSQEFELVKTAITT